MNDRTTAHAEDPVEVTVPFELGNERLAVCLGADLEVLATERTAGEERAVDRGTES